MNRRWLAILMVCVSALTLATFSGSTQTSSADDTKESSSTDRDRWMSVKLNSAQQILEDLTTGDFKRLETDARRMQVLNFLEQWARDKSFKQESEYQGQLNAFEFATKELVRHAADKNTEGALKSYVALTESCVHCHELIRDGQTD